MALETSAFTTYSAKGNREDLSNIIYNVAPYKTPFMSSIGKVKASNTLHEWQKQTLPSASATAALEGNALSVDSSTATTRLTNVCQISERNARVTGTQEAMNSAGRNSEMALQVSLISKALKTDVETVLLANTAKVTGNATNARVAAGLQTYVKTNINKASNGSAATGDGSDTYTDGTARALLESYVEDALAQAWSSGAEPSMAILGSFQKRKFAAFSGNSTRFDKGEDRKLINSVDVYVDPLGNEVRLVPNKFAPTDVVYFVDPALAKLAVLRDFQMHDIARTGDSETKQMLVEFTLQVGDEAGHAGVYDLTTS